MVGSLGSTRRGSRNPVLPDGDWEVDVMDRGNRTGGPGPGVHGGTVRVELRARQYMAVRARLIPVVE